MKKQIKDVEAALSLLDMLIQKNRKSYDNASKKLEDLEKEFFELSFCHLTVQNELIKLKTANETAEQKEQAEEKLEEKVVIINN